MITKNQVNYLWKQKALETLEIVAERESNRRDKSVATCRMAIIEGLYLLEHKGNFIADTFLKSIYSTSFCSLVYIAISSYRDNFDPKDLSIIAGVSAGFKMAERTAEYFRARRYKKEMDRERHFQLKEDKLVEKLKSLS